MTQDLTNAIRAAEQQRCDAMLANDNAALDAILDPRLHFAHATGAVDGKAAYLAKIAAGRIEYVDIKWAEEAVVALADGLAMLTGKMTTEVKVEGVAKTLNNRVVAVWGQTSDRWRMIAFQSTPLAG
jgi:ketosteroid isomerase-like protein